MRLSLITDEVSQDVDRAADFAVQHNLEYVAVRSAWGRNIAEMDLVTVGRLRDTLHDRGLQVSSVLSPLFKCYPPGNRDGGLEETHFVGFSTEYAEHLRVIDHLQKIAALLEAPSVRTFTYLKDQEAADVATGPHADVFDSWPAGLAALENEHTCQVATLAELDSHCVSQGLSAVIDPCNQRRAAGFARAEDLTSSLVSRAVDVHVKDLKGDQYVPVGTGVVDWPTLIERLHALSYRGFVTLESHLRGDLAGVAMSLAALRHWTSR